MPAPAPAPSGLPIGTLAIGGLAAAAGVVALLKKKKTPAIGELDVVAARSLGGKARVVWLNAGERSLVVAVTPQNVRLLAQWRRDRGVAADEPALSELLAPAPAPKAPEPPARTDLPRAVAQNPALSGILRLRERASTQQTEAITTGDTEADEQWAREILAAMGSRR
jgi:flagellar biogenesis protein FliO